MQQQLENLCRLDKIYGDSAFKGAPSFELRRRVQWEVVEKKGGPFKVLSKRWVVERTFAWLMNFRRLVRDYEKLEVVSRALIILACIFITVKKMTT